MRLLRAMRMYMHELSSLGSLVVSAIHTVLMYMRRLCVLYTESTVVPAQPARLHEFSLCICAYT